MPTQNMKKRLVHALEKLGVEIAGRHADHLRWSVTDLATDLAPLLSAGQEPARGEAPTQKAPHPFSMQKERQMTRSEAMTRLENALDEAVFPAFDTHSRAGAEALLDHLGQLVQACARLRAALGLPYRRSQIDVYNNGCANCHHWKEDGTAHPTEGAR